MVEAGSFSSAACAAASRAIEEALPAPGTIIMLDGSEAGEMQSGRDDRARALLRFEAVEAAEKGAALIAGGARIKPEQPNWLKI